MAQLSELEAGGKMEATSFKKCIMCHQVKDTKNFSKHTGHKDNLDGRCKVCVNNARKLRDELRKTAPPKPKYCQCCEKERKLCLDHCHITKKFRGWICEYCNRGIGQLDDNLLGVLKAVSYLENHEKN
jgi:hypothetical protein